MILDASIKQSNSLKDPIVSTLFNQNTLGVLILNSSGNILNANPILCKWLNYDLETLQNKSIFEICLSNQQQKLINICHHLHSTGQKQLSIETIFQSQKLELLPVKASFCPSCITGKNFEEVVIILEKQEAKKRVKSNFFINELTQAYQKSEAKFNKLFEENPHGVVLRSLDHNEVYVNKKFEEIVGYSQTEIQNIKLPNITHQEDLIVKSKKINQLLAGEIKSFQLEKQYKSKKGKIVHCNVTRSILKDETGKPAYYFGIVEDITKLKADQEKLKESQNKYKAIFDNVNDAIIITDELGNVSDCNFAAQKLLDIKPNEKANILDYIYEKDKNSVPIFLNEVLKKGFINNYLGRFKSRKGELKYIEISSTAIYKQKEFVGLRSIVRDITERKKAQKKLKDEFYKQQYIFDAIPGIFFFKDNKNNILGINKMAADSIGKEVKDIIGKNTAEFYPDQAEKYLKDDLEVINSGKPKMGIVEPYQTPEGMTWVSTNKVPFKDPKGNITGVLVFAMEVTELCKTQEALKESNQELKKVNRELDHFVYRASHDLRAPLASVLGLINVINLDEVGEEAKMLLDAMRGQIAKLEDFIQEIIDYSRISRQAPEKKKINLKKQINDILEGLKFMNNAHKIEKSIEIKGKEKFYSDERSLRMIFNNLLSNAIKYADFSKDQSYLKIKIKQEKTKVLITIQDNGIGISEENQSKIFEMFYRATNTNVGSGLGLFIVQEAVNKLNATIEVKSEIRKGSTFYLTIPNNKE